MRLFTLLAGYAAGLAVAMKVRRDAGQSKLDQGDPSKSTLDKLVDEVKDIHTSTYTDVKSAIVPRFEGVKSWDDLQSRVSLWIDDLSDEATAFRERLEKEGSTKKANLEKKVDAFFEEKGAVLEEAQAKGSELADTTTDTLSSWIDDAKARLLRLRDTMKENIKLEVSTEKTPLKKLPTKKTVAKKPTAKKTPVKKPQV